MPTPVTQNTEDGPNRWYLAYGSNLASKTFRGRRGIRPLSQTNVIVPTLELTFDLPGIPYFEPCFANVRRIQETNRPGTTPSSKPMLIGVAYLLTHEDYVKVIATEGGGASYQETAVECWRLPGEKDGELRSDLSPAGDSEGAVRSDMQGDLGEKIIAYTLLAPDSKRRSAPLQPSKRYINIIQAGARGKLPAAYIAYLDGIAYYRTTSIRQRIGALLFVAIWVPSLLVFVALLRIFADPETGRSPRWLGGLMELSSSMMWKNYDSVWKRLFGSGETTDGIASVSFKENLVEEKAAPFENTAHPAHIDFYRL